MTPHRSAGWFGSASAVGVPIAYGGAILALLIGEVSLARDQTGAEFGAYSLVRTSIPLLTAIALVGYDQALTREAAAHGRSASLDGRQVTLILRAALVSAALAAYLVRFTDLTPRAASALVIAAIGVTTTSLISGAMRADGSSTFAAFTQQGYRLLTGLAFLVTSPFLGAAGASWTLALAAMAVALPAAIWSLKRPVPWRADPDERAYLTRLGYGYALGMLALAGTDWIDQALIAQFGGLSESGLYAQTKLIAVYPLLSIGSILGFVALPAIARRRESLTNALYARWLRKASAATVACWLCAAPAALVLNDFLYSTHLPWTTVIVLVTVGSLRLLYVLPSAALGATATPAALARFGGYTILGLAVQVGTTLLLSPVGWPLAGAIGLAASVAMRLWAALVISRHSLRE